MPMSAEDLELWLARVRQSESRDRVFKVLDEFRSLDWTDEQRASMAKVYVRLLDDLKDNGSGDSAVAAARDKTGSKGMELEVESPDEEPGQEEEDGPVWYEKM